MLQSPSQVFEPVRLTHEIGVQRDTHDQCLLLRLKKHFISVVDDHVAKVSRVHVTVHDHGNIVEFLRVGQAPE